MVRIFVGIGPAVAFDDQCAGEDPAASGGNGIAVVEIVFRVVNKYDQGPGCAVYELIASVETGAAPAVVAQRRVFPACFALGGGKMLRRSFPGAGVHRNLVESRCDRGGTGHGCGKRETGAYGYCVNPVHGNCSWEMSAKA